MANPQPDLHTRLSNELLDALATCKFSAAETSILLAVLRQTYGYKVGGKAERTRYLSLRRLEQLTQLHRSHCCRAVKSLARKGVLLVSIDGSSLKIGIQKDYDQWTCRRAPIETRRAQQHPTVAETGNTVAEIGNVAETGNEPLPKPASNKRKLLKKVVVDIRAREKSPILPDAIRTAVEAHLGPAAWNQTILATILGLVASHGEAHTLRAIEYASIRAVEATRLLPYVMRVLESEAAVGYTWRSIRTWHDRQTPASAPAVDPETAWFERHQLYRVLDGYVMVRPDLVLAEIRRAAPPAFDLTPYGILEQQPPPSKAEQRRLIRQFVMDVTGERPPAISPPSYA